MTRIHHINCGTLRGFPNDPNPKAICHCLLLEDKNGLALVDTGFGLAEVKNPVEQIGQQLIDTFGIIFNEAETAVRQIEKLGFRSQDVTHAIITHCDVDHVGGLADFPQAEVHLSEEEHASLMRGHHRYLPMQFVHGPKWKATSKSPRRWFGLEARPVALGFESEILLIPLFGHTFGHCGVAIQQNGKWLLHIGDTYYRKIEAISDDNPITPLTSRFADDDAQRRNSLEEVKRLARNHGNEIELCSTHEITEFPNWNL
ncbi:MBL fold metallo-hydrolase [bacterium]|nr:MBL fold metallo-hydrolase [bacterium]